MCSLDYEGPSFSEEKLVKARKQHGCCECGRMIQPGETYTQTSGCWDGRMDRFRCCHQCDRATALIRQECSGWIFGNVEEDLLEHARDPNVPWSYRAARFYVGMRRSWKRFQGPGLMKPISPAWRKRDPIPGTVAA